MRVLLAVIITAALGWGGYWFLGARALEAQVHAWLDQTPQAQAGSVTLRGFPNRFDLTFMDPEYTGHNGTRWNADFAQVFALSYKPNHVILVLPHDQKLHLAGAPMDIHSRDMRASVVTRASTDLPLDRFSLVSDGPRLSAPGGFALQAEALRLATRQDDEDPTRHTLGFELLDLQVPPVLRAWLDPESALPAQVSRVHLDAGLQFDGPLDRHASERMPRITGIDLTALHIAWGPLQVDASGPLQADALGRLSGDIDVTVTEWRLLLEAAQRAQLWDPGYDMLIVPLLQGLANEDGEPSRLTLPLMVRAGQVFLGPVALGYLPPLPVGG